MSIGAAEKDRGIASSEECLRMLLNNIYLQDNLILFYRFYGQVWNK